VSHCIIHSACHAKDRRSAALATEVVVDLSAKLLSSIAFPLAFRHTITFPFSSTAGRMQIKCGNRTKGLQLIEKNSNKIEGLNLANAIFSCVWLIDRLQFPALR